MEVHRNRNLNDLDGEVWRKAIGLEGYGYMISNYGRLKRLPRQFGQLFTEIGGSEVVRERNGRIMLAEKIIVSAINYKGYVRNYIKHKNIKKSTTLHRMVALAFIPNPNNYDQINHKNGIKTDNRVENLEWCNNSQNQKHRFDVLGAKTNKAFFEKCIEDKMVKVVRICPKTNNIEIYNGVAEAARQNPGAHTPNISKVCLGKRPKCGGFKWMRLSDYEKIKYK